MVGRALVEAGVVLLLDQTTKALALRFLPLTAELGPRQPGVFALAANGGWWGGRVPTVLALLALWSTALTCTVLVLATSAASPSDRLAGAALVVALGGATGNLLDRVRRGAVIDFIAIGSWPSFNLADVAIVAGVAVAVCSVV